MKNIAVIGATGMLGKPVVHALLASGLSVRVIGRDLNKLTKQFARDVEYAEADVADQAALRKALTGCDAVHINLAAHTPESCQHIQVEGCKNIAQIAKELGLKRISYLSGTTTCKANAWHYDTHAKLQAEQAIKNSGVPYLIFCPSWFFETLADFIVRGRAQVFGKTNQPIRWLSAKDYATRVAQSYLIPDLQNLRLHLHGPKALDMYSALQEYCSIKHPEIKVSRVPMWLAKIMAKLSRDPILKDAIALLAYYEKVGELADPSISDNLLGELKMELKQWATDSQP